MNLSSFYEAIGTPSSYANERLHIIIIIIIIIIYIMREREEAHLLFSWHRVRNELTALCLRLQWVWCPAPTIATPYKYSTVRVFYTNDCPLILPVSDIISKRNQRRCLLQIKPRKLFLCFLVEILCKFS